MRETLAFPGLHLRNMVANLGEKYPGSRFEGFLLQNPQCIRRLAWIDHASRGS